MRAYVLVQFQPGREEDIYVELNRLNNIKYADVVHGPYDMVVVLEGDMEEIDKTIMCIRRIPYIKKTESLLSFDPLSWTELSYELASGHLCGRRFRESR